MLVHAPGVYEHLMQVQDNGRPRVEIGFGVSTLFGLIPFLAGCMILGVVALVLLAVAVKAPYSEPGDRPRVLRTMRSCYA